MKIYPKGGDLMKRHLKCHIALAMIIFAYIAVMVPTSMGADSISIKSYQADLYLNGTLEEKFVYQIEDANRYRMLYRSWKLPVSSEQLDRDFVEPIMVFPPKGTVGYFMDRNGKVTVLSPDKGSYADDIKSLAQHNEVGCFDPNKFAQGIFGISYLFKIHPSLECDNSSCHWNLRLADEHLPYQKAAIYIHDPDRLVVHPIPHPDMYYRKEGNVWIINGSSPKDGLIEVEMLLRPNASSKIAGFVKTISSVEKRTISAQKEKTSSDNRSEGEDIFQLFLIGIFFIIFIISKLLGGNGGNGGNGGDSWGGSSDGGGDGGSFGDGGGSGGGGGGAR